MEDKDKKGENVSELFPRRESMELFLNEYDYSEIFKSPEEAATMMDIGEGDTLSLVMVEVLSCGKYKGFLMGRLEKSNHPTNTPNGIKNMEENNEKVAHVFTREIIMADGDYICPVCNQGNMVLTGRKTLGFPVDRKAYCPLCLHEEEF